MWTEEICRVLSRAPFSSQNETFVLLVSAQLAALSTSGHHQHAQKQPERVEVEPHVSSAESAGERHACFSFSLSSFFFSVFGIREVSVSRCRMDPEVVFFTGEVGDRAAGLERS